MVVEQGEVREGVNNLSLNIQTMYFHGFSKDHGKQLKHRYDCSALAREKAKRESISLKENSFPNPPTTQRGNPSALYAIQYKKKTVERRFIHNFKETALVTFT